MDTLLILKDTITAHVVKVVDSTQPYIQEAGTNCNDVAIVFLICATIVAIALITKCAILSWKSKEIKAEEKKREFQKEKEKIESERRQAADDKNRNNMLEDESRKKKAVLLEKELQILKELCYETKDGDTQLKAYGDDIERYFKEINSERGVTCVK